MSAIETTETVEARARRLVQAEVMSCLSSLVSTLAGGYGMLYPAAYGASHDGKMALRRLDGLTERAIELASPIPDYEEAAIQAGWHKQVGGRVWLRDPKGAEDEADGEVEERTAEDACQHDGIEPYYREVFEFWAVSKWFGERLTAAGEKVDDDFAGMTVWARTTTGQAIYADGVIERIAASLMQD